MGEAPNPFEGSGSPVVKYNEVGDAVEGTIVRVQYREARDLDGNVKRFPDGNPMPVVVITLDTEDGEQRDFVQGRSVSQLREKVFAVEGVGEAPKPGANYRRELSGLGKAAKRGYSPEKLFDISYSNSAGNSDGDDDRELV